MSDGPRLTPIPLDELTPQVREAIADWPLNLHRSLAHSPATLTSWMVFAAHILRQNTLPVRDREIVVLRIAWNRQSDYEWMRHGRIARGAGMTEADIRAITRGSAEPVWAGHEAALLDGVDQLLADNSIAEATWALLAAHYTAQQLVDLVMLIGEFMLVAMTLGALRVDLDPDVQHIPPLSAYR